MLHKILWEMFSPHVVWKLSEHWFNVRIFFPLQTISLLFIISQDINDVSICRFFLFGSRISLMHSFEKKATRKLHIWHLKTTHFLRIWHYFLETWCCWSMFLWSGNLFGSMLYRFNLTTAREICASPCFWRRMCIWTRLKKSMGVTILPNTATSAAVHPAGGGGPGGVREPTGMFRTPRPCLKYPSTLEHAPTETTYTSPEPQAKPGWGLNLRGNKEHLWGILY